MILHLVIAAAIITGAATARAADLGLSEVISDPNRPWAPGYRITEMAITNSTAYFVCSDSVLRVIDLSNPAAPFGIGQLKLAETNANRARITLSGTHAYVSLAVGYESPFLGNQIIDVSDPANLHQVGFTAFAPNVVHGSRAYQVEFDRLPTEEEGSPGAVLIIDIADPLNPKEVGRHPLPLKAAGEISEPPFVIASGNIIAVVNHRWSHESPLETTSAEFVDCQLPSAPVVLGKITRTIPSSGVTTLPLAANLSAGVFHWVVTSASITSGYAYHVESYDVSDFSVPKKLGTHSSSFAFSEVNAVFSGTFVHVGTTGYSSGAGRHDLIDLTVPAAPARVGTAGLSYAPVNLRVSENIVLFSCRSVHTNSAAFNAVDFSIPNSPRRTFAAQTSGNVADPFAPSLTLDASLADNVVNLRLLGPIKGTARIERSTDLQNWIEWKTTNIVGSPTHLQDSPSHNTFYRALVTP